MLCNASCCNCLPCLVYMLSFQCCSVSLLLFYDYYFCIKLWGCFFLILCIVVVYLCSGLSHTGPYRIFSNKSLIFCIVICIGTVCKSGINWFDLLTCNYDNGHTYVLHYRSSHFLIWISLTSHNTLSARPNMTTIYEFKTYSS